MGAKAISVGASIGGASWVGFCLFSGSLADSSKKFWPELLESLLLNGAFKFKTELNRKQYLILYSRPIPRLVVLALTVSLGITPRESLIEELHK